MKIAVCTNSAGLSGSIERAFREDGDDTSCCLRFDDPFSLMRYLSEVPVDIVLVDADRDFASVLMVLAWRSYYAKRRLPIIVIGERLDCETMIRAFNAGADDIVVGASHIDELAVRVRHSYTNSTAAAAADSYPLARRVGAYYYGVQLPAIEQEPDVGSSECETNWKRAEPIVG